ncbi:MAG: cobalamin B12-binding domain-containing protein [Actinomycetota bacterium]
MTAAGRSRSVAAAPAGDLEVLRDRLWEAVSLRDEQAAVAAVLAAVDAGADPEAVIVDVIAPVQRRVGAEWAANRIGVAQEHAATAINDRVVAALARRPERVARPPVGTVIVACVDGEWHAMPARLLGEVLAERGWRVDFLGAHVPATHLVAHVHQTGADVVALSASIPARLPVAHAMISACRTTGVPVLAGGAAFGPDGRYARLLGADAWAPDARAAADRLADGVRPPASRFEPAVGLEHLADGEHARVARSATSLVTTTMAGLEERLPAVRTYTDQQRERTAEDIGHIVDYLAAALYVDDDDLFATFITWTADVLAARGVPATSLHPGLDLLAAQLRDLPRAVRIIGHARQALDAHLRSAPA